MRETVVYGLFDTETPERIRYVGRTIRSARVRLGAHWRDAKVEKNQNPIHRWMRKYLQSPERVGIRVLEECSSKDEVNRAEIRWIAEYRRRGQADLNLLDGGQGTLGQKWTPEIREKRMPIVPRGEGHYFAKLTSEAVKELREWRTKHWRSNKSIAEEWGMSPATIAEMLNNQTWYDPDFDPSKLKKWSPRGGRAPNSKLTWDQVNELRRRASEELKSTRAWAREFGTSQPNVRDILNNKIWQDEAYDPSKTLKLPRNGEVK